MKKYVIGAIIGALLSFSTSVYGEGLADLIGKKVDGTLPFKINGKKSDKDVIVIEGTSYMPIRASAELFSYDIEYDEVNKEVHMQSKKYKGLSDLEKAIRNMSFYYASTNVPSLNSYKENKIDVFTYQNEIYIPLSPVLAGISEWNGTTLTIQFDGKTITATRESNETNDAFLVNGSFYVKLSALGLKSTVTGDTLIIEKQ